MTATRRQLLTALGVGAIGSIGGCLGDDGLPGTLAVEWVSETGVSYDGNHHAIATATLDGEPIIGVPRSDVRGSAKCGTVALDADGNVLWAGSLPPADCNAHAIGDLNVAPMGDRGRPAFLAATKSAVHARDAATGERRFTADLIESLPFSAPVVRDVTGDGGREVVVGDFTGTLSVMGVDGEMEWTTTVDRSMYVTPIVTDLTGTGRPNVAVNAGHEPGRITCFTADGALAWETPLERVSLNWTLVPGDQPKIAAESTDSVRLVDGSTGETEWTRAVGTKVAVGAATPAAVFTSDRDGHVRRLGRADGAERFATAVAPAQTVLTTPTRGALSGGDPTEIVTATGDGTVVVLDADSGDRLAKRTFESAFYTPPVTADITGTGSQDVILLFGDGRVGTLTYDAGDAA